jgi:hemoglobin-like flavoprotein
VPNSQGFCNKRGNNNAILESWGKIQAIPNYKQIVADTLFRMLFELEPTLIPLFPSGRECGNSVDEIIASPLFQIHAEQVIMALDYIVMSLLDLECEYLIELGERHAAYGLQPEEHFPVLAQAVLLTLQVGLGDDFTDELKGHCVQMFNFLTESMTKVVVKASCHRS